jgi:hypothetical protein
MHRNKNQSGDVHMNKKLVIAVISCILVIVVVVSVFTALQDTTPEDNNGSSGGGEETFSVDSDGGWVKPTDSAASLRFDEGSVSEEMDVTIESTTDLPEEEGLVPELGFEFGPDGIVFNEPVSLYIDYSGVEFPEGVEEYMLRIYKVEDGNFTMIPDCEVDLESKTVQGRIYTFSTYVVMGKDYGFILKTDKDRLASDTIDTVTITVYLKKLNEGDTSEPTGEPMVQRHLKMEYTSMYLNGSMIREFISGGCKPTNEYGYVKYQLRADPGPARYGLVKISTLTLGKISATLVIDLGFEWPYYEHFDDDLGTEWTCYDVVKDGLDTTYIGPQPISIKTSPNGQERFLGPFTTDQVVLTLENLPSHYKVIVEFDFIAIGPWQGGYADQFWLTVKNDPDREMYSYGTVRVTLQKEDYVGGFDEDDIINTLGYPTAPLTYTDPSEDEIVLDTGDGIFDFQTEIQHFKDSIQIAINVDERGFGEECDAGQYWGLDNVYVRLVFPE